MVSGTPLCTKIADLHGELNFLQVWPFCLSDSKDGFWEMKIGVPFEKKDANSLHLLYSLMDSVMMRHSKTQTYLDGRPLVSIPSRTIEWRPIDIENNSEKYIFHFLAVLAADACGKFLSPEHGFQADRRVWSMPHFAIIRSLLGLMSRFLTSPRTLILKKLDHIKRLLVDIRINISLHGMMRREDGGKGENGDVVPLMSAEQVLFALQQVGQGANGGLNRFVFTACYVTMLTLHCATLNQIKSC
jgi:SNF2-related domain